MGIVLIGRLLTVPPLDTCFSDVMVRSLNPVMFPVMCPRIFAVALTQNVLKEAAEGSGKSSSLGVRRPWDLGVTCHLLPVGF